MKTMKLSNGNEMPAIGLGTWKMDDGVATSSVSKALNAGYRHIDCASIYANEADVGAAFGQWFGDGNSRDDLFITSKLWNDCHRAEHVMPAIKDSLKNLQIDVLDLYLIHWPVVQEHGVMRANKGSQYVPREEVPTMETWNAMEQCVEAGLCRSIGVCNFSTSKLHALIDGANIKPVVNQIETHPYFNQADMLDFCNANGIVMTAYSPLGSGDRPERLKQENEPVLFEDAVILAIANESGLTAAQVLIAWAIGRGTIAIPKSSNEERLRENLAAAEAQLTPEQMQRIDSLERNFRFVSGKHWEIEGSCYTAEELWS